jgi:hypothetical protein
MGRRTERSAAFARRARLSDSRDVQEAGTLEILKVDALMSTAKVTESTAAPAIGDRVEKS